MYIIAQDKKRFGLAQRFWSVTGSLYTMQRRGDCEKQGVECEEENGGTEDTDLENEDYIYTNSLLP